MLTTEKGTTQEAERPTGKPGATLTRVPGPGEAKDFCPSQLPVQTASTGFYDILPSATVVFSYVTAS